MVNRKTIRAALATALTTGIPSSKVWFAYLGNPGDLMPAVSVTSRHTAFNRGQLGLWHGFDVHLLVLAGKVAPGVTGWKESDAEDSLDDMRVAFDNWVETVPTTACPYHVERDGASEINMVDIGGEQWIDEMIPIVVPLMSPT